LHLAFRHGPPMQAALFLNSALVAVNDNDAMRSKEASRRGKCEKT